MRDEKLVSVAVKSKQPVERVVWVYGAILESASEIDDNGRFEFDAAEAAYFLRSDEADILAIENALVSAGRICENVVVMWSDRQFQSDKSTSRQAAYRERKRAKRSDSDGVYSESDVTPPSPVRHVTAQDTDTDTDTERYTSPPTQEAIDLPALTEKCREAAGWQSDPSPNLFVIGGIAGLIKAGCDLEMDVLATIRAKAYACRGQKTWKFFIGAIQQARDDRLGAMSAPNPTKQNGYPHAARPKSNSIASGFNAINARIEREERELAALENSA